uniref:Uncharacterized protein n=1 Tax=Romanomermis culicivorax TaxID=13658 RepID=A0A915JDJ0_ROMCU
MTFYDQCMSEQTVSKLQKIDIIVNHISKVSPLPSILLPTRPNNATQINIWELMGQLQKNFAVSLLFEVGIDTVVTECDQEKYVLKFSPPPSKNATITDSVVIKNIIRELGEMRNITIDAKKLDQKVEEMFNFAADLQNLIKKSTNATILNSSSIPESEDDGGDSTYFKRPIQEEEQEDLSELVEQDDDEKVLSYDELSNMNSKSNWGEFFGGLFGHRQFKIWNKSEAYFLVVNEQYFQELQNILDQYSPETIFNYMFFTIVEAYYNTTNDETPENPKNTSRNLECLEMVGKYFASAMTRMIFDYQGYDIMEWRTDLEMMFEMIRSAFKFLVSSAEWLENDEKMNVISKANAVQFYSGIPKWLNNNTEVNRRTFEFDSQKSIIENTLNIGTKIFDLKLDQVVHDTTDEDDEPNLEVNASYGNLIVQMYIGQILPPAYHPNYPLAVKYGDIGWVMGHELLHAFDETGVDEVVRKFNHPLFSDESRKAFDRRILCLKKQLYSYCFKQKRVGYLVESVYQQFCTKDISCALVPEYYDPADFSPYPTFIFKEKCVSGKQTLAETMADVDGLKVAFMAYKFSSLTLAEDPPITGLTGYSSEQIFFMTAGRSYCTSNKNLNEFLDTTEEHAPNQPRIQISMRCPKNRRRPFEEKKSEFWCRVEKFVVVIRLAIHYAACPMARLAQLDSASALYAEDRGFELLTGRYFSDVLATWIWAYDKLLQKMNPISTETGSFQLFLSNARRYHILDHGHMIDKF